MQRITVITSGLVFAALIAPFFFPWQLSVLLSIAASFFFPPAAILSGVLLDALYSGAHGFPYFTPLGVVISVVAYFVQQFMKTRIMS